MKNSTKLSERAREILFDMYMKNDFPKLAKNFTQQQLIHITSELLNIVDVKQLKKYYNQELKQEDI